VSPSLESRGAGPRAGAMPTAKGSPQKSERPPSPLKRKKSVARAASPRASSPTPRAKENVPAADSLLRSNLSLAGTAKKLPPRAPNSHPTGAAASDSPAESLEASPRPSSPVPLAKDSAVTGRDKERVRVFVRMRPLREAEGEPTIRLDNTGRRMWLSERESAVPLQFDFDGVLTSDISQHHVYESVAQPLVEAALNGYSACLMCYGQTGTGKTYTFGGGDCLKPSGSSSSSSRAGSVKADDAAAEKPSTSKGGGGRRSSSKAGSTSKDAELRLQRESVKSKQGVVGRALRHVLEWAGPRNHRVCIAYVQVYMELLQDLLRPESSLSLREHPDLGVYVHGAQWTTITTAEAACAEVASADARRTTAFTKLNADSSRSHAVLMIAIRGPGDDGGISEDVAWASAKGRLFLVDLAGSERTKRSGVVGQSFDEAVSINQSLTTLGRCIQAMAVKGAGGTRRDVRAPVRESKLTRLLSPCLGGSMTSLVCCLSSAPADRFETLSTLEFGRNAMRVMLKPQSQLGVDFKSLTIELQAQLDARSQATYEMEAAIEARVRADFEERLRSIEIARREAEVARQKAELALDRRAESEKTAKDKAESSSAELSRLTKMEEAAAKTARASHDSRAAIIATADSLATEVVRARRERDEALNQLEMLTSHGLGLNSGASSATDAEAKLGEGASPVEREIVGGLAELSVLRAQVERRKVRARAAAARAVPSGMGSSLMSSSGGFVAAEQRVATDRRSITQLRTSIAALLGGLGELLAGCVELGETQHPDLWQGTAEQLALVDQIRAAHRLVHMLGCIHTDFADAEIKV